MRLLPTLLVLAACAKHPAPQPESQPVRTPEASAEMLDHFALASRAQEAVINGDLDGARMAGRALSGLGMPSTFPPDYRPYFDEVSERSSELAESDTLNEAAARLSQVGVACGICHSANNAGPKLDAAALPQTPWVTVEHMPRHKWAADWMWLGLIGPSDAAWRQGASALSNVPVFESDLPPEFARLEAQVHDLAAAMDGASALDRPLLYAQFIASCGECHAP